MLHGELQLSSGVIFTFGFSPSVIGVILLLFTCLMTDDWRWLGVACWVALILHGASVVFARQLYISNSTDQVRTSLGRALLGDLLLIGWAIIAVITLTKYALFQHGRTRT
jgi:fucose 4-O-acetylase-like acetyltransferase